MTLQFRTYTGPEIADVIAPFAALRCTVFRDFPYLYDGDLDYERRYLARYTQGDTILIAAFDGDEMVGAATGMPLSDHADDFSTAFENVIYDFNSIFYCAESVLLSEYRGQGAGHHFFDAREAHAKALNYSYSTFCAVQRPSDHPARPQTYRPLDPFWRKRGYAPLPGVVARFSWRDVGEAHETEKPLQVWMKTL